MFLGILIWVYIDRVDEFFGDFGLVESELEGFADVDLDHVEVGLVLSLRAVDELCDLFSQLLEDWRLRYVGFIIGTLLRRQEGFDRFLGEFEKRNELVFGNFELTVETFLA